VASAAGASAEPRQPVLDLTRRSCSRRAHQAADAALESLRRGDRRSCVRECLLSRLSPRASVSCSPPATTGGGRSSRGSSARRNDRGGPVLAPDGPDRHEVPFRTRPRSYCPATSSEAPVSWGARTHVRELFAQRRLSWSARASHRDVLDELAGELLDYDKRILWPAIMSRSALERGALRELRRHKIISLYRDANEAEDCASARRPNTC